MSIRVMSWVLSQSAARGAHRLVALALADFAHDDGRCWPGLDRIAEKAAVSRSSVKRATAWLLRAGELERFDRGTSSNLYRFTFESRPGVEADEQPGVDHHDDKVDSLIYASGLTMVPQANGLVGSSDPAVGSSGAPCGLTVGPRTVREPLEEPLEGATPTLKPLEQPAPMSDLEARAVAEALMSPKSRARRTASRRRPEAEALTPERLAFALECGMTRTGAAQEWAKMGDHEYQAPRSDWSAAWRNWCRGWRPARQDTPRNALRRPEKADPPRPQGPGVAGTKAWLQRLRAPDAHVEPDTHVGEAPRSLAGMLAGIGRRMPDA